MKFLAPLVAFTLIASLSAAELPKIFVGFLEQDIPKKGAIGKVMPPPEIDKYIAKVESSARKDPKWFREFSSQAKPGIPLPYDERLGLTKPEYEEYMVLWAKRGFKPMEEIMLLLRQNSGDTWSIQCTGNASMISTLRYDGKTDTFRSPNGVLKRIEDVHENADSVLGEWSGFEWNFEEETGIGKTRENIALGRLAGDQFGLVVYRAQEISSEGTRLMDKNVVIRFPLSKVAAQPAPKKSTKK